MACRCSSFDARSLVNRLEHLLGSSAYHHLACEDVDLLDLELDQILTHLRCRGLRPPAPLLILKHCDRHNRPVAGADRLVVKNAELLLEPVGKLCINLMH